MATNNVFWALEEFLNANHFRMDLNSILNVPVLKQAMQRSNIYKHASAL